MAPDIAVLRQKIHGLDAEDLAAVLRSRLPEYEVAVATTPQEERELLRTVPIATGVQVDPGDLDVAENLELFACVYAGTDHLPMEALERNDVSVTNASGVHGPNIAEWVLGAILSFTRRFHLAWRRKERREWRSFPSRELAGSTVTVVGLGAIGTTIVDRLDPFDVETIGIRYTPEKGGPTDHVLGFEENDVHEAFSRSDYVVLAAPLTDVTEGLVDANALRTVPAHAVLLNVGRGPLVDTDALVDALQTNAIRGAALDVTDPEPLPEDHELWGFDNVLITPHNAGHTPQYFERLADIIAGNLDRIEETGTYEGLENQVA
ncbi:D-2-hydroxyacid dehydrogenase [Halanaeroarchaeum sulfurireducens]|uniref:D-3-phosphoglycerate dehydrogenase n=1 Tax=Halanaeroarchaeum sulfurireducens TaxID=1604004 RepID=A0A0F7PF64_9EURY|nr:D-3-phosphoglycerate dehydrogenase [Halanaeroarchaeum sulfurireducens]ALG82553.1 D-3-phosphoglycerate dehydrogenase [Halanaeroarchaeum sulfurireducens]